MKKLLGAYRLWSVLLLLGGLFSAAPSFAAWYPSPTGWRGPIREAGRPWLEGYAYPRRSYPSYYASGYSGYRGVTHYPTATYTFNPNTWYFDASTGNYWYFDAASRYFWYYNPSSRQYFYAPARG